MLREVGLLLPCHYLLINNNPEYGICNPTGQMALLGGARASVDWYHVLSLVVQVLPGDCLSSCELVGHPESLLQGNKDSPTIIQKVLYCYS